MHTCPACQRALPEINRYCTYCGTRLNQGGSPRPAQRGTSAAEELNLTVLYGMVTVLILALLFPPWETAPGQTPQFLGMHFILSAPESDAVVSRMLLTIELVTITIAGLYGAFLLRKR